MFSPTAFSWIGSIKILLCFKLSSIPLIALRVSSVFDYLEDESIDEAVCLSSSKSNSIGPVELFVRSVSTTAVLDCRRCLLSIFLLLIFFVVLKSGSCERRPKFEDIVFE
jgi:hypothetical protein